MKGLKYGLLALAMSVTHVQAGNSGNSGNVQDFLSPANESFQDGMGKITFDCNTGEFIFRGHGLNAGRSYFIRIKGNGKISDTVQTVGKGMAGVGQNVLIKGNITDYLDTTDEDLDATDFEVDEYDLGSQWRLIQARESGESAPTLFLKGPRTLCYDEVNTDS